ncbi:uncharacterized protein LOC133834813 [Humulus lupulus]|uniref:uncharacterized protein LOC133834813 n=1 Tax=Humulus lupulus TaxID=3486 RepID=UPI002B405AAA|nr:uncharacterized protein LOC133834813 [Humulus lupulus]
MGSDHKAIVTEFGEDSPSLDKREKFRSRFHFEEAWCEDEECKWIIDDKWNNGVFYNNPSELKLKTKGCKEDLRRWNHEMRKQMNARIVEVNQRIKDLSLSMDPCNWKLLKMEEKILNCLLEKKEVSTSHSDDIIDSDIRGIQPKIMEAMNESLLAMFTKEDVISAVKGMNPIKALGIDGLPALVFQKFWSSVAKANKIEEYRPISLCNVVYKIVSKCLVERMKSSLMVAISNSQSAFVSGRMIHDNEIIGYEGMHCMRKDRFGNGKKMALKLDTSKVYDRDEWRFVEHMMLKLGYHGEWVKKIMGCINYVSFSFLLNGDVKGKVIPERGLRQGDPLSPFIFILCAEALSCLILDAEQRNLLEGLCFGRNGVKVSHLFFAYDNIMFLNAHVDECRSMKEILHCYSLASSQVINFSKSEVYFGNKVDDCAKKALVEFFEVKLPIILRGKEVLIKAVVQAMLNYAMNCFKLPLNLINNIHSIAAKFWWGSTEKKRKIHWCKWEVLCRRKLKGGMGFKDMELFNKAMLAKQCWRLLRFLDSLVAKVLRYSYHNN